MVLDMIVLVLSICVGWKLHFPKEAAVLFFHTLPLLINSSPGYERTKHRLLERKQRPLNGLERFFFPARRLQ